MPPTHSTDPESTHIASKQEGHSEALAYPLNHLAFILGASYALL